MTFRALTYISIYAKQGELFVLNALIGLSWGVGCILGPIVGGGFAVTSATWRWVRFGICTKCDYQLINCNDRPSTSTSLSPHS
jgi:MFS family permease